mgnify:CR=1 FL=1
MLLIKRIIKDFLAFVNCLIPFKKGVPVLMYHSIADSDWFFSISPEIFERQMRYLKEHCNPVRLDDVADFARLLELGQGAH